MNLLIIDSVKERSDRTKATFGKIEGCNIISVKWIPIEGFVIDDDIVKIDLAIIHGGDYKQFPDKINQINIQTRIWYGGNGCRDLRVPENERKLLINRSILTTNFITQDEALSIVEWVKNPFDYTKPPIFCEFDTVLEAKLDLLHNLLGKEKFPELDPILKAKYLTFYEDYKSFLEFNERKKIFALKIFRDILFSENDNLEKLSFSDFINNSGT